VSSNTQGVVTGVKLKSIMLLSQKKLRKEEAKPVINFHPMQKHHAFRPK